MIRLSDFDHEPSFALLSPGWAGPGWLLLRGLGTASPERARLVFAAFEDRVPTVLSASSEELVEVDLLGPPLSPPVLEPGRYGEAVHAIRNAIAAGDVYQVNLTVRARLPGATGPSILSALCRPFVPRFAAWVRLPGGIEFVSGSPELFFETDGGKVRAEPMKGTGGAGRSAELQASEKDRSELAMITDLVRNDLTPVCRPGTIEVPCPRRVVELPYAVQAVSDVTGVLLPGLGPLDVLAALHPGGSVTGAPKSAALCMIRALEDSPRGPYCGALGLIRGTWSRFAVLIRTATRRAGAWEYGTGGGIVFDSDPDREWAEVRLKAEALRCDTRRSA